MTLSRSRKWLTCGPDSDVLSSVRLGYRREWHGGLTAVVHVSRVYSAGVLTDHLVKKTTFSIETPDFENNIHFYLSALHCLQNVKTLLTLLPSVV